MAVNVIDKKALFSYIGSGSFDCRSNIQYWLSDWIDIDKFSQAACMPAPELESSFIDSIVAINIKQTVSIRHCPDCLLKGYHSVFFYLKFITHCPWHKKRLICCRTCSEAMSLAGLGPKKIKDINEIYFSLRLPCGHFSFDSRLGYDLGYNDQVFYNSVCAYSSEILGWLRRVPHCDEVASSFISCLYDGNSQNELGYKHCVDICSAKIGHVTWLGVAPLSCKKIMFTPQHCTRLDHTKPLSVLKSIRRYIYREYLRSHKKCLRTLLAMDRKKLHCLDIKCACSASSAMLGWMYSLGYVPGSKSDNVQPPTLTLGGEKPSMLKQVAILWLSQFFGIWASIEHELQRASIRKGKFKISLSSRRNPNHVELSDHCVLITSSQPGSIAEFTVIIRDPSYLSLNSFQRCLGRLTHDKAVSPASTWVVFHWAYEPSDEIIMRYWANEATADRSHFQTVLLG